MKTAIESSNVTTRWSCPLCGGSTWKTGYIVSLVHDDGTKTECVCEGCMKDGPEGAALRMRVEAERLRGRADWLDATAPEVAAIAAADWMTVEQANTFSKEQWRGFVQEEAIAALEAVGAVDDGGPPPGFVEENDIPF